MEQWMDAKAASAVLGISVSALHRLCARGTLAYRFVAGRRLFLRASIEAFATSASYLKRTRRIGGR